MGIDVTVCKRRLLKWVPVEEGWEHVASIDTFINLVKMFGLVLEPLRNMDRPEAAEAMRRFENYIHDDHEKHLETFKEYYIFVTSAMKEFMAELDAKAIIAGDCMALDIETIEADARAFFGRLVLTPHVIPPEEAAIAAPVCTQACELFRSYSEKYQDPNPDLALALSAAHQCLATIQAYCTRAIEEKMCICFSV